MITRIWYKRSWLERFLVTAPRRNKREEAVFQTALRVMKGETVYRMELASKTVEEAYTDLINSVAPSTQEIYQVRLGVINDL